MILIQVNGIKHGSKIWLNMNVETVLLGRRKNGNSLVVDGIGRKGLFLRGDVGIGKTFGLELLAAKFGWKFVTAREVEGFFRAQPDYDVWENYCRAADFFGRGKTRLFGTKKTSF